MVEHQDDEVGCQLLFFGTAPRCLALCRAMLSERRTGATLGHIHHLKDLLNTGTATRGAQKFPRAASCRMSLSSVRSETALRRRLFSCSSSFSRLICSVLSPPYSWRHLISNLADPDLTDRVGNLLAL